MFHKLVKTSSTNSVTILLDIALHFNRIIKFRDKKKKNILYKYNACDTASMMNHTFIKSRVTSFIVETCSSVRFST